MADQQENASHERQKEHQTDSDGMSLLQKSPITENSDCLSHIFMNLNMNSLMNIAHSSKLFQTLAATVFKRKFGTKTVLICCFNFCSHKDHADGINRICIRNLEMAFPFLRVFGAEISKLIVHYDSRLNCSKFEPSKRSIVDSTMLRVNEYVNTYCADTLSSLEWLYKPKLSNDFTKPFKMVEKLCIRWTFLSEQLLNYNEWFPNLQRLDLLADSIDPEISRVTLPQLKHLSITFTDLHDDNANMVQITTASEFLSANPQLQSIMMGKCAFQKDLKLVSLFDMISGNSSLSKVELCFIRQYGERAVDIAKFNQFAQQHPQLAELSISDRYKFKADDAMALMQRFTSLKKFRFSAENEVEYNKFFKKLSSDWIYTKYTDYYSVNDINLYRK